MLHGRHHSLDTIVECLKLLAERSSLAAIHRVKGIKEETVMDWLEQAVGQVEVIEQLLLRDYLEGATTELECLLYKRQSF